jgi:protein gp37
VVSFEPLIEPIGDDALDHIDWLVGGGEGNTDDVRRAYEL